MKLPALCDYHRSVYEPKVDRARRMHRGALRDLRDQAVEIARQCPACKEAGE